MSDILEEAKKIVTVTAAGIEALDVLGARAGDTLKGARAWTKENLTSILVGVVAVVEAVQKGVSGEMSVDRVTASLADLAKSLSSNDAAADAEIDKRFPR